MKVIQCLCTECINNKQKLCTKRPLHFIGMKCLDVRLRLEVFRNVKGEVLCLNTMCTWYRDKVCGKDELYVGGEGCITKEEWGKYDVGRSEGRRS